MAVLMSKAVKPSLANNVLRYRANTSLKLKERKKERERELKIKK
jgi:hypothetical protein